MQSVQIDREDIKKQIDTIIAMMEEQIETVKEKQVMIDKLIDTTEQTSKKMLELKETSAEMESKNRGKIIAVGATVGALFIFTMKVIFTG